VPDIADFSELCGLTVGLPAGALEIELVEEASATCTADGDQAITLNTYDDLNATILALTSGRIQVAPNDSAANAYVLEQQGSGYKISGAYSTDGYFAAAFPKDSELTQQVMDAFQAVTDDGTYQQILDEWGVGDRALKAPLTNASPF
jgi:polar amino acid transport system substrate-binding protein